MGNFFIVKKERIYRIVAFLMDVIPKLMDARKMTSLIYCKMATFFNRDSFSDVFLSGLSTHEDSSK